MEMMNICVLTEDFTIYKVINSNKYYMLNKEYDNLYSWTELELISFVEDREEYTEEELINKYNADVTGEELNGTNYLYFKIKESK